MRVVSNGAKYRDYYFNRTMVSYILNLEATDTLTPGSIKAWEILSVLRVTQWRFLDQRLGLRGNGRWFSPTQLTNSTFLKYVYSYERSARSSYNDPAEVIIKTDGANVIASQIIEASFSAATGTSKVIHLAVRTMAKPGDTWKASAENGSRTPVSRLQMRISSLVLVGSRAISRKRYREAQCSDHYNA